MSAEFVFSSLKKIYCFLHVSCSIFEVNIFILSSTYTLFIDMVARQFHDLPTAYKLISGVCLHGAVTNEHLELSVVPL